VLDDVGTKIDEKKFAGKPSPHYILETSPGNFQWGYFIEPSDPLRAAGLINALAEAKVSLIKKGDNPKDDVWAGWTDRGAKGQNRVVRVPGSINKKHGQKFASRVVEWFPGDRRWSLDALAAEYGVTISDAAANSSTGRVTWKGTTTNDRVYNWLQEIDYVLDGPNADGYASIICPWADEHTDPREDARWAVGEGLTGAFNCFHGACQHRHTRDLLEWAKAKGGPDFSAEQARHIERLGQKLLASLGPAGRPRGRSRGAGRKAPPQPAGGPPDAGAAAAGTEAAPDVTSLLTEILDGLPIVQRSQLPSVERTAGGGIKIEQKPTAENVGFVAAAAGFVIRKNELSGEVEITHDAAQLDVFTSPADRQRIVRELLVSACQRSGINVRGTLQSSLEALAAGNGYHPIVDWATSAKWDGKDRIATLARTLTTKDEPWRDTAVRRWLLQVAAACTNWQRPVPVAIPYVLTLVGPQGIGKTSWFRSLLPRDGVQTEAALHLDSMRADDQKRKVLSSPIVELGELETTFGRSEMGALKAFLSNTVDRYRLPYDRDVTIRVRCTAFGASVNETEFLLDPTGARRFWPVEVTHCNWQHGLDLQQLWAQVFELLAAGERWVPDEEEAKLHVVAAERHRHITYAESLLDELVLRKRQIEDDEWTFASAAEVGKYYRLDSSTANWRAVGRALRKLFGDPASSNGKRGWRVPIRKHEFSQGYIAFTGAPKLQVVK
jgi:hypothetical protein